MALSFVPGPIMEAAETGLKTGSGSPRGSWKPPNLGQVSRPASDEDLAFMTVGCFLFAFLCRKDT